MAFSGRRCLIFSLIVSCICLIQSFQPRVIHSQRVQPLKAWFGRHNHNNAPIPNHEVIKSDKPNFIKGLFSKSLSTLAIAVSFLFASPLVSHAKTKSKPETGVTKNAKGSKKSRSKLQDKQTNRKAGKTATRAKEVPSNTKSTPKGKTAAPAKVSPVKATPAKATPTKAAPVKATPVKNTATKAKAVEQVYVEDKSVDNNSKYTYIGVGLVAVSIIAALVGGDGATSSTKSVAKKVAPIKPIKKAAMYDDDEDDAPASYSPPVKSIVSKPIRKKLPSTFTADKNDDGDDDITPTFKQDRFPRDIDSPDTTSASAVTIPVSSGISDSTTTSDDDDDVDDLFGDYTDNVSSSSSTSTVVDSKPTSSFITPPKIEKEVVVPPTPPATSTTTATTTTAVSKKQSGGILSRFFQKPGSSRETDLISILNREDTASEFRAFSASFLAQYIPSSLFPQLSPEGIYYDKRAKSLKSFNDVQFEKTMTQIMNESELTKEQAAELFADVTSAILVALVDRAVDASDKKKDSKDILKALDDVTYFISNAGGVFGKLYAGITIEPVQYNGKAKKSTIENLYYTFFKTANEYELKKSMEMLSAASEDGNISLSTNDENEAELMSMRNDTMGLLQRALAIKESKKSSLEQKATKEIMMNSGLGAGGGGGIGDLMGSLTGKGGPAGMMDSMPNLDFKQLEEMIGSKSGEDPLKGLSEEEMMEMTKQSVDELKTLLAEGNVTKEMVKEMEQNMGLDFGMFVSVLNNPAAKGNLKNLGPDVLEMIDLFKELNKIKNS